MEEEDVEDVRQDLDLINPDSSNDFKYKWDEEFQRHVISLIILDRQFLLQAMDLVKPKYFTNRAHQMACTIVFDFFKKYSVLPEKIFLVQEIKDKLRGNKSLPYYLGELNLVYDYFQPGMESRDYLTEKIHYFAKIMAVRNAYQDTVKLMAKGGYESEEVWGKVHEMWRSALLVERNFDIGMDYFKTVKTRLSEEAVAADLADRFKVGFPSVDEEIRGGFSRGEILAVVAASCVGKCFAKNTPILMFDGTIKSVQDIVLGDLVMGNDSTPRKVLRLVRGKDSMYDIVPTKGMTYRVNSDHVLSLKGTDTVEKNNRCINPAYSRYRKSGNVVNIPLMEYIGKSNNFKNLHKGYRVGVDFKSYPVKITPYILGVWLGDGKSRGAEITNMDKEVVAEWRRESKNRGMKITKKEPRGKAWTYAIVGSLSGINSFKEDLRSYDLILNKHVPHDYKVNSRYIRLEILAGLLDTDGSKSNNCFDFVNKNKILADDVVYLARSLGFAAYIKPCRKRCVNNGQWGDYWRVTISGNTSEIPVRIVRKKCNKRRQNKDVLKTGVKVVPVGNGDYFGFETDGNHLFLLGDFTVVHNSVWLACFTAINIMRGKRGVYISCELKDTKVCDRMDAIFTGFNIRTIGDYKEDIFKRLDEIRAGVQPVSGLDEQRWYDNGLGVGNSPTVLPDDEFSPLIVKKFPAGEATVNTIRAYISQLRFRGFTPDFIIVDYVGEMADIPGMETHQSRERIVRNLRGMAEEENVFVAIAIQPNRGGKEAQKEKFGKIDDTHFADSFGQIKPLDGAISLMQNDAEKQMGLGRGYVIKLRDGKSRFMFYITFDQENLRITEVHKDTYRSTMATFHDKNVNDVDIDSIRDMESQAAENTAKDKQKKKLAKRKEKPEEDIDQ